MLEDLYIPLKTIEENRHNIVQDGKTVFKYAVTNMADASELILKRNNLTNEDVDWFSAHQANKELLTLLQVNELRRV
jgi:3-oxoacyl-[acyl-carrier-protein] synthase-3